HTLVADLRAGDVHAVIAFHAGQGSLPVTLPPAGDGLTWHALFGSDGLTIEGRSVAVFQATAREAVTPPRAGVIDGEFEHLATLAGIEPVWWDVEGHRHVVPVETTRALLSAMRLPVHSRSEWAGSLARLEAERAGPLPPM